MTKAKHLAFRALNLKPLFLIFFLGCLFYFFSLAVYVFRSRLWVHGKLAARLPAAPGKRWKKTHHGHGNVFSVSWNITNLVKCHLEWESKPILIRVLESVLFKASTPGETKKKGGQLIATFDVMFSLPSPSWCHCLGIYTLLLSPSLYVPLAPSLILTYRRTCKWKKYHRISAHSTL